jgi:hypothetical protein
MAARSKAQTVGSWIRSPLKASMSVRVYSVFVLSCVDSGLEGWLNPRPRSRYGLFIRSIFPDSF